MRWLAEIRVISIIWLQLEKYEEDKILQILSFLCLVAIKNRNDTFGKDLRVLIHLRCCDLQSLSSSVISNSSSSSSSSSSSVVKTVWQKYAAKIWESNETVHIFEEKFGLLDYTHGIRY
ncbi:hypothetical protein GQX74_012651 [Glossina fuscipes]|nr:hypothetical protein GQX74_012651 [Glossina fuscipes]